MKLKGGHVRQALSLTLSQGAREFNVRGEEELRSRSFAGRRMFDVLGRVKIEDLAALAGSRIDGAQVFAPFHFPNRCDYAVFLNGLIGDLFFLRRRGILRIGYGGLAFRHRNAEVLLFRFSVIGVKDSGTATKALSSCWEGSEFNLQVGDRNQVSTTCVSG